MIKQSLWGLAIVLLALARTCAGDAPSSAQPVDVGSSQSLMLALNDPTVSTIILNGEQFLFAFTHVQAACAELPRACIDQTSSISIQMPDAPQTQIELLHSDVIRRGSRCAFGTPL